MANAITSLGSTEDLQIIKIYYSSASNQVLNFSEYVQNYDNIRSIVWCGAGSNNVMIFNYQDYLDNLNAGNAEPVRINSFGKDNNGNAMNGTPAYATDTSRYYYFKQSEWNAGGDLKLYNYSSGSSSTSTYARYSRYVYLVYKKES